MGVTSLVSVAVMGPGVGSITPTGSTAVAVLTSEPTPVGVSGSTVPVIVTVAVSPLERLVSVDTFPVPDAVAHEPVPLATQVHVEFRIAAGIVSVNVAPVTVDGPWLVSFTV